MAAESEAFIEWSNIFTNKLLESYINERKEFKKAAMLATAFQCELQNIQENIQRELSHLRDEMNNRDCLKNQLKVEKNEIARKKKHDVSIPEEKQPSVPTDLPSPDIFLGQDSTLNSSCIELTSDDDTFCEEVSPTLISKRKRKPRLKNVKSLQNITKNFNKENSLFADSPHIKKSTLGMNQTKCFTNKKKNKRNTLTQIFSSLHKSNSVISDDDETYLDPELINDKLLTSLNKTSKDISQNHEDLTIIQDQTSQMGVTRLLEEISKKTDNDICENDEDSSNEVDELSKGMVMDNSPESPKKKFKKNVSYIEPVVRGKARKQLKGFSCVQCENFYAPMNLPPEELQKKLDACSRHRYKYKPPEDTNPVIWNLTIPEEKNT